MRGFSKLLLRGLGVVKGYIRKLLFWVFLMKYKVKTSIISLSLKLKLKLQLKLFICFLFCCLECAFHEGGGSKLWLRGLGIAKGNIRKLLFFSIFDLGLSNAIVCFCSVVFCIAKLVFVAKQFSVSAIFMFYNLYFRVSCFFVILIKNKQLFMQKQFHN